MDSNVSGVSEHFSRQTVQRALNAEGYFYLQARKKGLLLRQDLGNRVAFLGKVLNQRLGSEFSTKHTVFYLDGTAFQFKTNPLDQTRAPKAIAWRKKQEGLHPGCTAKGKKEGLFNANSGVFLCEQYDGAANREKPTNIVRSGFPEVFALRSDSVGKRFLMDGCPRQNSKKEEKQLRKLVGLYLKHLLVYLT